MTFGALTPLRASGATIESKKAEAAQLEADIQANGDRIAALGEQYNGAVLAYQDAQTAVTEAHKRLVHAHDRAGKLSALVSVRAAALYQGASDPMSMLPSTNIKSVNELGVRTEYGSVATGNDEQLIADLSRSQQDLKIERKRLDKQVSAARQRDFIASARQQIEAANAHETELLSQVKGEIATLIARGEGAEGSRAQSACARAAREPGQRSLVGSRVECRRRQHPEPARAVGSRRRRDRVRRSAARQAVRVRGHRPEHLRLLRPHDDGVGRGRRSMPHYSGAQYAMFPHVPLDQLQPGDLLFWGPGGSEHVAMYIGGGLQIAATHTGDYVRIQPVGSNPVGAARPG